MEAHRVRELLAHPRRVRDLEIARGDPGLVPTKAYGESSTDVRVPSEYLFVGSENSLRKLQLYRRDAGIIRWLSVWGRWNSGTVMGFLGTSVDQRITRRSDFS